MSWALESTRDSSGNHTNGWVSNSSRLIAALSTPSSTRRAASRSAPGDAHRNEPVSVVNPAYRHDATSRSMALPHASSNSATTMVVESAAASTRFTLPNKVLDLWWSMTSTAQPSWVNSD